jgi:hypothetical protein
MARPTWHVLVLACAAMGVAVLPASPSDADVAAIKQTRVVMNKLAAAHDMEGLRKFLNENATMDVMVNGPAWRYAGRESVFEAYKARIANDPERALAARRRDLHSDDVHGRR